jgi:hypothetical protein
MTEIKGLHIETWESINGTTWSVCEGYCIISMHKTEEAAESAMGEVRKAREEREKEWARLAADPSPSP